MSSNPDSPPPHGSGFEPVRLRRRRDGWTPERQRAFVAALRETKCVLEACRRVGKSPEAAYRLYRHPAAASFRVAWDEALRGPKPPRPKARPGVSGSSTSGAARRPSTTSTSSTSVAPGQASATSTSSTSAAAWQVSASSTSSTSGPEEAYRAKPPRAAYSLDAFRRAVAAARRRGRSFSPLGS